MRRPDLIRRVLALTLAFGVCLAGAVELSGPAGATGFAATTMRFQNSPTSVVTGQPITFTVTVSGSSGTPTGTVIFSAYGIDNTYQYVLCKATLVDGVGRCESKNLQGSLGSDPGNIAATYSGDAVYALNLKYFTVDVGLARTTLSLQASANPSPPGVDVTFKATVKIESPGAATRRPAAYVMFTLDQDESLCIQSNLTSVAPFVATCTVSLPAGRSFITAQLMYGYITGLGGSSASMGEEIAPKPHGYWLVGGDGGIFTFGSAQFHGSTGNLALQRPVVGITPTRDRDGYWLVASDGGIFAFGDSGFYGSIPGQGIAPAGTPGAARQLNAPIVGMVPSFDQGGYFMVAADGGVFAFGDARFAGSCPGIGGCAGPAVAVMPDATGNGYWLVTETGNVYAFGDAPNYGTPGSQGTVTSAVRTPDGRGYWILFADGQVYSYGDAGYHGGVPAGDTSTINPASAIFSTDDGAGYWIATAQGDVYAFNAPYDGSMAGIQLNAPIIAATGW